MWRKGGEETVPISVMGGLKRFCGMGVWGFWCLLNSSLYTFFFFFVFGGGGDVMRHGGVGRLCEIGNGFWGNKNKGFCFCLEVMISSGINLVMTVIGFAVSTMFIVFVCTRLVCARIQLNASRRSFPTAARSDLSIVRKKCFTNLMLIFVFLVFDDCCLVGFRATLSSMEYDSRELDWFLSCTNYWAGS